jgi:hypothetical protein
MLRAQMTEDEVAQVDAQLRADGVLWARKARALQRWFHRRTMMSQAEVRGRRDAP